MEPRRIVPPMGKSSHMLLPERRLVFTGSGIPAFMVLLLMVVVCHATGSPNGTETLITTDTISFTDTSPAIFGDNIACVENSSVIDLYNLASGEKIRLPAKNPLFFQDQPAVDQDTIIWQEYDGAGYAEVIRYNITSRAIEDAYPAAYYVDPFTWDGEFTFPKTDGKSIVWQNYNTTTADWDIAIVRPGWISPKLIIYTSNSEKHPSVQGNSVVYENWTDPTHAQIWRFNLSSKTAVPLSPSSDQQTLPQISGTRVAWQAKNTSDARSHIDIWENGVTNRLTPPDANQEKPSMSGNRIAVEDYRRMMNRPDIYVYEFSPSLKEIYISPNHPGASQKTPAIWNNRIVWEDTRSGNACGGCDSDIFLFTLGPSGTCPVADFFPSVNAGPGPLPVIFSDRSAGSPILYHIWNYSHQTVSFPLSPEAQVFNNTGVYHGTLTIGNTKCRNTTPSNFRYNIYVDSPPDADFTAKPSEGRAPLSVQFTDTSGGVPASWTWHFGDGSISHLQNPFHTYASANRLYTVSLTVNNTYGGMAPDTQTKTGYIRTFLSSTLRSDTPVPGITIIPRYGGMFLIYNATMLPDMAIPRPTMLMAFHPDSAGWQNISFTSSDPAGFSDTFGNQTFMGNLSSVSFQTDDVIVSGVSPRIGTGWGVNYQPGTSMYPSPASISTAIWEGATSADREWFLLTIIGSNYIENPDGIAYTARIRKNGFPASGNATINMSVDRSWINGKEAQTYLIGYGVNTDGDTVGSIIPARYLFNDGTLDYFESEVPDYYTTFGISPLSGNGNPFQLITLSITSHINPPGENTNPSPSAESAIEQERAVKIPVTATLQITGTPLPEITPHTITTARIYTNANGAVTRETRLRSADKLAEVFVGEGIVALDESGRPLPQISLNVLPPEIIPAVPAGSALAPAGMGYELGPENARFAPQIIVSLDLPADLSGRDYTVKSFDRTAGAWEDLPATVNGTAGIIAVPLSRPGIIALFTRSGADPPSLPTTPVTVETLPSASMPPPTSAVSIFLSMIGWAAGLLADNILVFAIIIVVLVGVYLYRRGKLPGAGW